VGDLGRGVQVLLSWHRDGGGIHALNVPRDPVGQRWTSTLLSTTVSSPPQGEDLALGDLDRDVISIGWYNPKLWIFENLGTGGK